MTEVATFGFTDDVLVARSGRVEPMSRDEARVVTDQIQHAAEVTWHLLAKAHAGRAWEALGYPTWERYVKDEFNISRSRSYQLLDQARVITAIQAVAPDGTDIPQISEKAARDLKRVLSDVVPDIERATASLTPADASNAIDQILADYRTRAASDDGGLVPDGLTEIGGPDPFDDDLGAPFGSSVGFGDPGDPSAPFADAPFADAPFASPPTAGDDGGGAHGVGGPGPGAMPFTGATGVAEPAMTPRPGEGDDDAKKKAPPRGDVDAALLRRNVQACFDLYAALAGLKSMPDVDDIVKTIPPERRASVSENLTPAMNWLTAFAASWRDQPWQDPAGHADD